MSILDNVKSAVVELLQPGTKQKLGEREALRLMYSSDNAQHLRPNTWARLVNASGETTGYQYFCNCLRDFKMVAALDWLRDNTCPYCGTHFSLYKDNGITDHEGVFRLKSSEISGVLARLPVRPAPNTMAAGLPFIDPGDIESGEVEFVRSDPFSGR